MLEVALDTGLFVVLAGLAFAPLEHLFGEPHDERPELRADLGFATFGELIVQLAVAFVVGGALALLDRVAPSEPLFVAVPSGPLRTALVVGLGLLVFETMGYAYHRAAHRVPALWRLHAVHHSAPRMDWLASFRQHPLEIVLMTLVQNVPLVLLGLPLGAHALVLLLVRLNTVFVHANLRLRPGRWQALIASPAFHHRHHQREGEARNFAGLFPWLDRAFGTYDPNPAGPVGLDAPSPTTFVGLLLAPFVRPLRRSRCDTARRTCRRAP